MGEELAQVLTPQVIIVLGISVVVGAVLTAGLFMFFIGRTAKQGIQAAEEAGGKAIDAASSVVKHVTDKGADVLKPVSEGVGDILGSLAERIRPKQRELDELAAEKVRLAQELERLKSRRIEVTQVRAQFKLAVLEITQRYHSFRRTTIKKEPGTFIISSPSEIEYLGLQRATCKTQVGIDLEKLRFAITADGVVLVHGLHDIEVIGVSGLECENLLGEMRRNTLNDQSDDSISSTEVLSDSEHVRELVRQVERHRTTLMEEIQGPQSVEHWAGATATFALGFLRACLAASGATLEQAQAPIENGMDFVELCEKLNSQFKLQIESLESGRRAADAKTIALQRELIDLVEEARRKAVVH